MLISLFTPLSFERKFDTTREEIIVTTTQIQPALVAPSLEEQLALLKHDVDETVAAYDMAAAYQAQRRAKIAAAVANAKKHRVHLPEHTREDAYSYDDGGEAVTTLQRSVLRQGNNQPAMWTPVYEVLYQWEIPDLPKALYLTEQQTLTRQTNSVVMSKDMRTFIAFDHPYVVANIAAIRAGLGNMRFALRYT